MRRKRIYLFFICLFVLCALPISASASEENAEESIVITTESIDNIIADEISSYSDLISEHINADSVEVSNVFPIYRGDNYNAFQVFLFDDDECFGFLTLSCDAGDVYTSVTFDDLDIIDAYLEQNAFFYVCLYQDENQSTEELTYQIGDAGNSGSELHLRTIDLVTNQPLANYSHINVSLNVARVANGTVNGTGICWAASVAAVANYRNGTNYTAQDIYDAMDDMYLGTPAGNTTWYNRAFSYVGLHCSSESGGVSYSAVNHELSDGNPAIFSVKSTASGVQHAIVCKSIKGYTNGLKYGFMDPNHSGTTYSALISDASNPDNFVYTSPGGTVYNSWLYFRYSII